MTSFHAQSFKKRMETAGDTAENAFREYAQRKGIQAERYGFDRSKLKGFGKLPAFVKATPDFACVGKTGFLVECKGVGRFDHVKIKQSDIEAFDLWYNMTAGYFFIFIFDSHLNKTCFIPFSELHRLIKENTFDTGMFHDNDSPYYKVPKSMLMWEDVNDTTSTEA